MTISILVATEVEPYVHTQLVPCCAVLNQVYDTSQSQHRQVPEEPDLAPDTPGGSSACLFLPYLFIILIFMGRKNQ